jgi:methylated-DNA-[protein]-cysteine S-methyltransferase
MASDGPTLVGLWFCGQKHLPESCIRNSEENHNLCVFKETRRWLDIYFSGKGPHFLPSINLYTTDFRKSILKMLMTIPFGQTVTYGQIARCIAQKRGIPSMAAQAVGNAVAHNPIAIIIPCHRVVGTHNSLTGYAAGIDKKIELLKLENPAFQL